MTKNVISLRTDRELIASIDRVVIERRRAHPEALITRGMVLRTIINNGLRHGGSLEQEPRR